MMLMTMASTIAMMGVRKKVTMHEMASSAQKPLIQMKVSDATPDVIASNASTRWCARQRSATAPQKGLEMSATMGGRAEMRPICVPDMPRSCRKMLKKEKSPPSPA